METSIDGARGVLVNITGSIDIDLDDVEVAASLVAEAAHPDANIIFGASFDEDMEDEIRVVVIATRFDDAPTITNSVGTMSTINPQMLSDAYITKKVDDALKAEPEIPAPPPPPPPPPPPVEEDPFDTIFKIFNSK
jgi:cell division protein FtsZ